MQTLDKGDVLVAKKPADYASDQEVRWCPGCGDYAILKTVQRYFAEKNINKDDTVFISGIGCASRFPYYMNTYGLHTIHGRAPAFATGLKIANPNLDVWVVTGDGDGMAIGAGHMLHLLRRNLDLQVLLFNNRIYGLTKGQASPTSAVGLKTPSTPKGSVERGMEPSTFALASGATFVGRAVDVDHKRLIEVISNGHRHRGTSFVEIWQNCIIYNHQAFAAVTDASFASERQLFVEDGKPLLFGKNLDKGIVWDASAFALRVVNLSEHPEERANVVAYDKSNLHLAQMVTKFSYPDFPTAFGVLYQKEEEVFSIRKSESVKAREVALETAIMGNNTWLV